MNKRIAKKRAREFSAACVTVPMVLAHARPSFYGEGLRKRAQLVYEATRRPWGLRASRATARAAKRVYLRQEVAP